MVRWPAALKAAGSPFHDSTHRRKPPRVVDVLGSEYAGWLGCGWVEHNRTDSRMSDAFLRGTGWGFGTLLGPEETPWWVLFSGRFRSWIV